MATATLLPLYDLLHINAVAQETAIVRRLSTVAPYVRCPDDEMMKTRRSLFVAAIVAPFLFLVSGCVKSSPQNQEEYDSRTKIFEDPWLRTPPAGWLQQRIAVPEADVCTVDRELAAANTLLESRQYLPISQADLARFSTHANTVHHGRGKAYLLRSISLENESTRIEVFINANAVYVVSAGFVNSGIMRAFHTPVIVFLDAPPGDVFLGVSLCK